MADISELLAIPILISSWVTFLLFSSAFADLATDSTYAFLISKHNITFSNYKNELTTEQKYFYFIDP